MKPEPKLSEVLEVINVFAQNVDDQFSAIRAELGYTKTDVGSLRSDMATSKSGIISIKATMVTKSYLDDKLGALRGDLVLLARKGNRKLEDLIDR